MSTPTDTPDSSPDPVFVPAYPFTPSAAADAILRSCDGADFHVIRAVLSLVSPFFETLWGLPQADGASKVPVVDMEEGSVTLDRALRMFYPGSQGLPVGTTVEELGEAIEVLVSKFDIDSVVPTAKKALATYMTAQPLAVYAIAFAHRWEDIGLAAAKECLKLPLRVPDTAAPPELAYLSSTAYYNLLHYHFQCATALRRMTRDLAWLGPTRILCWFTCTSCQGHPKSIAVGQWEQFAFANSSYFSPPWVRQFLKDVGELVAATPVVDLSQHPAFFAAIDQAADCKGACRRKALPHLDAFIRGPWADKVNKEIAKVEWKFYSCSGKS
ncbi:hypothetical protein C8R46DRAFT_390574 [Mycena filopes]|nr:hypothetical protein C8R46DRAFT_390574 [Mycena filopes]